VPGYASSQAAPPAHGQFRVAIYIPVGVVERMQDPAWLQQSWDQISSQVHVDKVYIESYRSGLLATDAQLQTVKTFFKAHGVLVAGGIAFVASGDNAGRVTPVPKSPHDNELGFFGSFSYTDPADRAYVKHITEVTARNFDEIMLDDFFFNNTKLDSDIAAKGAQSWTDFRLKLMDEVSRDLVEGPAKAVNPKVKVIIKFPNWYQHFQANGYDLDKESKIFDGIYTGTETRDPVFSGQHLQQYESYELIRYFDNIAPGRNGGGWIDFGNRYIDRNAEQLWDTMLAKAPQMMLFQYSDLLRQSTLGDRAAWSSLDTTFKAGELQKWSDRGGATGMANQAAMAGYSLDKINAILGKLGKPVGIASYRPYQSIGEDFLHDYFGMIGVPIELYPAFPAVAKTILLTEDAKTDKEIVSKIKKHLEGGGNIIITSGLLKALQDKGLDKIAEIYNTGNVLKIPGATGDVLVPEIQFMTNDAWALVQATANGHGAPLLTMDRYSKGILFVLTIPENSNDLYALKQSDLNAIRQYILRDFPVEIDSPSQVSLFAYDNNAFVVESCLDAPTPVTVGTLGSFTRLRNLVTGEVVEATKPVADPSTMRRRRRLPPRTEFHITVEPHSLAAFAQE
jgi:hypothetical protein